MLESVNFTGYRLIRRALVMTNRTNYMNKTSWVYESLRKHSVMGTVYLMKMLIIAFFFCRLLRVFVPLMVKNS